jgi:hypothetical protein
MEEMRPEAVTLLSRDQWGSTASLGRFGGDGSVPFDHQSPIHGIYYA